MLPFNIISELSRTLALAVRLFGNMMSGVMIIGILLTSHPLFFRLLYGAGFAHRHGAGLYLQHSGRGLHCRRHTRSQTEACSRSARGESIAIDTLATKGFT